MNKTKFNYWLDVVIALAFLMSAITGIAFLFIGPNGYQGGRNASYASVFLGLERAVWSDLHTLSSLVLIAGIGVHLVVHWKWIVYVGKRVLPTLPHRVRKQSCDVTA